MVVVAEGDLVLVEWVRLLRLRNLCLFQLLFSFRETVTRVRWVGLLLLPSSFSLRGPIRRDKVEKKENTGAKKGELQERNEYKEIKYLTLKLIE